MVILPTIFAIIGEVTVYSLDKISLILPKGITIGSSIDDLKATYGEPNEINDFDDEDLKDSKRYVYYNPKYNNDYMSAYWAKELNFNKKILEGIDKVYESIPKYY